MKGNEIT
ncbi:hypothetical protein YPPY99_1146, partial [Yersinia pestis PY-99]